MQVPIIAKGQTEVVGGTSCSAPITAGVIALLNNYRISQGKSPLGWLNPMLYANPSAFNIIRTGNNKSCSALCCCPGFNVPTSGVWNPVTGLGSINYAKLLAVVKTLP